MEKMNRKDTLLSTESIMAKRNVGDVKKGFVYPSLGVLCTQGNPRDN